MEKITDYKARKVDDVTEYFGDDKFIVRGCCGSDVMLYDAHNALFRCPCGCGELVLLGINGTEHPTWKFETGRFNEPTLVPSVNQIGFRCKSHYFVTAGKVRFC